jgi:hypothetical protein
MIASKRRAIRVTVAGGGDAFGSGGRFQACVALGPDDGDARTVIDCGATAHQRPR